MRVYTAERGTVAMSVVTIGLDLAKSVFQVHGVDAAAHTVLRRRLSRTDLLPFFAKQPPCVIGMATALSSSDCRRPVTNTRALSSAKRLAIPRPIPALPRVTSAPLPDSFPAIATSDRCTHLNSIGKSISTLCRV